MKWIVFIYTYIHFIDAQWISYLWEGCCCCCFLFFHFIHTLAAPPAAAAALLHDSFSLVGPSWFLLLSLFVLQCRSSVSHTAFPILFTMEKMLCLLDNITSFILRGRERVQRASTPSAHRFNINDVSLLGSCHEQRVLTRQKNITRINTCVLREKKKQAHCYRAWAWVLLYILICFLSCPPSQC